MLCTEEKIVAEGIDSTECVESMAVEMAQCMFKELRDTKKATLNYLSSGGGEFSWGKITDEEHLACIGKCSLNFPLLLFVKHCLIILYFN